MKKPRREYIDKKNVLIVLPTELHQHIKENHLNNTNLSRLIESLLKDYVEKEQIKVKTSWFSASS